MSGSNPLGKGSNPLRRAILEIIELLFLIVYIKNKSSIMKFDKTTSALILRWAKKIKAINILGGRCEICGSKNIFHLVFHHINSIEKENTINGLKNYRWSIIEKDLEKCQLLCANCHKELHFKQDFSNCKSRDTIKRRYNKEILLELKGCNCNICGYNKNNQALSFHHIGEKSFIFNAFRNEINIYEMQEYIKTELDNCIILCHNCHIEEHCDKDFFFKYEKAIYEKANNYKEKQSKLPIDEVISLYENGMRQIDISRKFNASKGTISGIIKKWKTNTK